MPLKYVVLKSRNKDNKDIEGFHEREWTFLTTDLETVENRFHQFIQEGLEGEYSRCYIGVNARDAEKVNRGLVHYLIDNPTANPAQLESRAVSIAMKPECAAEHTWLFDFDSDDKELFVQFKSEVKQRCKDPDTSVWFTPSPHGYHLLCQEHFDTRDLVQKYPCVTLMRDACWFYRGEYNTYD